MMIPRPITSISKVIKIKVRAGLRAGAIFGENISRKIAEYFDGGYPNIRMGPAKGLFILRKVGIFMGI